VLQRTHQRALPVDATWLGYVAVIADHVALHSDRLLLAVLGAESP
jgi:hypothetical protein